MAADPLFSVEDQVVLVSGGSRGIGRGLARGFVERGANVIITGREVDTLKQTASEMSGGKYPVSTLVCDVSQPEEIEKTVASVIEKFGKIDTLLNVAGVNRRKAATTFTVEDYDFILDINLKGAFFMAQTVGKHLVERRQGSVINIDSLNSHAPLKGVMAYAMSKAGVKVMTRGLAMEWGQYNVRVNGLAPGFILTDLTQKLWSEGKMQQWNQEVCPMKRLGNPEDLVGTAVFLASPAAAFLTGQTIYVDGGVVAGMVWPIEL